MMKRKFIVIITVYTWKSLITLFFFLKKLYNVGGTHRAGGGRRREGRDGCVKSDGEGDGNDIRCQAAINICQSFS
jgi:hypothetical protein